MQIQLKRPRSPLEFLRLWGLYLEAFPASERKPFAFLVKMNREGTADFWRIEADGKFAGLAFVIHGDGLVLLDYFAIDRSRRGRGAGSAALRTLLERYREGGFFLEIESTREEASNAAQRQKRKAFYLGCGLQELNTEAMLFGVRMELLGLGCSMDYAGYKSFYRQNLGEWAAGHVAPIPGESANSKGKE